MFDNFIKRLFCFHPRWKEGRPIGDFRFHEKERIGYKSYHCKECGKVKLFGVLPIDYIEP